jgi:lipoprotein-releasing system ATP-binding protein
MPRPHALIDLAGDVRKSYNPGLPSEAEVLHGLSLQVDAASSWR